MREIRQTRCPRELTAVIGHEASRELKVDLRTNALWSACVDERSHQEVLPLRLRRDQLGHAQVKSLLTQ
jgi:hypothetical protein